MNDELFQASQSLACSCQKLIVNLLLTPEKNRRIFKKNTNLLIIHKMND